MILVTCFSYSGDGYKKRINYYSNPDVSFNGMPTGVVDEADNHRVFTEHRFDQAARGDESGKCGTYEVVDTTIQRYSS